MAKRILIDAAHPEEIRVAVAIDSVLQEFDFETSAKKQIKSNIYLGKVTRVEPSLQAAFVEYGGNRQGFLPFSEIHYDYYQIPVADKEKLAAALEEAERNSRAQEESAQNNYGQRDTDSRDVESQISPEISQEALSQAPEAPAVEGGNEAAFPLEVNQPQAEITIISATEQENQPTASEAQANEQQNHDHQHDENETVEDVAFDEMQEVRSRRTDFYRKYKIQEVLKRNQIVLVQVIKEERGNKGASLTTYISLAGRYCVFMPNTDRAGGVSRRITDMNDRRRLKEMVSGLELPKGSSVIMRTAGIDRDPEEIKRDYEYLQTLWEEIKAKTLHSEAPAVINEEGNLIKRSLRDMYRSDVSEIIIEGNEAYKNACKFMEIMDSGSVGKVIEYKNKEPLFQNYRIDDQLDQLYENTARLPSGGSIVITPTEALVSIDVNSGRSTRERSIEETALKTNVEAAIEVARQMRLRDLAGLLVIDFIDMRELRNKRTVERTLKDALKTDRAKIQLGRISPFGLLEMSRQRMRSSIVEASTTTCSMCRGTGIVRSDESTAMMLLRAIESEAARGFEEIRVRASYHLAFYLLNNKRMELDKIGQRYSVNVQVDNDPNFSGPQFAIDRQKSRRKKTYGNDRRFEEPVSGVNNTPVQQEVVSEVSPEAQPRTDRQPSSGGGEGERREFRPRDRDGDRRGRRNRNRRGGRRDRFDRDSRQPREDSGGSNVIQHEQHIPDDAGNKHSEETFADDNIGNTYVPGEAGKNSDNNRGKDRGGRRGKFLGRNRRRPRDDMHNAPTQQQDNQPVVISEAPVVANEPKREDGETSKIKGLWKKITQ